MRLCIWWSDRDSSRTDKGAGFMLSHANHRIGLVVYKYVAMTGLYDLMPCRGKHLCLLLRVYLSNVGDKTFNQHKRCGTPIFHSEHKHNQD